jgi:hypothetical protein
MLFSPRREFFLIGYSLQVDTPTANDRRKFEIKKRTWKSADWAVNSALLAGRAALASRICDAQYS